MRSTGCTRMRSRPRLPSKQRTAEHGATGSAAVRAQPVRAVAPRTRQRSEAAPRQARHDGERRGQGTAGARRRALYPAKLVTRMNMYTPAKVSPTATSTSSRTHRLRMPLRAGPHA